MIFIEEAMLGVVLCLSVAGFVLVIAKMVEAGKDKCNKSKPTELWDGYERRKVRAGTTPAR